MSKMYPKPDADDEPTPNWIEERRVTVRAEEFRKIGYGAEYADALARTHVHHQRAADALGCGVKQYPDARDDACHQALWLLGVYELTPGEARLAATLARA